MYMYILTKFLKTLIFCPFWGPFLIFEKNFEFFLTYGVSIPTKLAMGNPILTLFLKNFHFLAIFFDKQGINF